MVGVKRRDYYTIIGALSAFETSQEVTFTPEELVELTATTTDGEQEKVEGKEEEHETDGKRVPVHAYLGGKVDLKEASNANYDLSHTLLGGYVPAKQLESLSSIDFAHYFHKLLECDDALQVFDMFLPANSRMNLLLSSQSKTTAGPEKSMEKKRKELDNFERVLPDGKIVRKVIVCQRCKHKFRGPDRMKLLKKHACKAVSN